MTTPTTTTPAITNAAKLRASQLRTMLAETIPAREAVLISGAPGIGKTDILKAACADAGAECIVMHPVVSDPTDFKGLPWVTDGGATFLPFGELARLINASKLTACFLDDLGQATPAVQAAAMQLILARRINGHEVSPNVVFLAATNRRGDRAGVSGILEPVKSRFISLIELIVNANDWQAWGASAGIAPLVLAFIRSRPELLLNFEPSADIVNSPSPRTWGAVSRILGLKLPPDIQLAMIAGAIGSGAAFEFVTFMQVWQNMVNPDLVLTSPDTAPIPSGPANLYALATALAFRVSAQSMGRYIRYLDRLQGAGLSEFAAVSMKTATARPEAVALTNTAAYVQAMSGQLGSLMIGGDAS